MLQKYFPILGEVNSPLAALAALNFSAEAVKIAVAGVNNETLETLLWAEVENTPTHQKEIEVAASALEAARVAAAKTVRTLRYRAAMAARAARDTSKAARRIKAMRRPVTRASLKSCKGLSIEICRQRAADAQKAVLTATTTFNTAAQAAETATQGGDVRAIRTSVAALKVAVRTLEVRHVEFKFAREMLSISLARHSA